MGLRGIGKYYGKRRNKEWHAINNEYCSYYCHPSHPDVDDWHAVHSIAETIYNSLEEVYELELGVLLSKLEASGIDTSKLTIIEEGR